MVYVFLDASALAKRYVQEPGSEHLDSLFELLADERLAVLSPGVAEVVPVLVRKRNARVIQPDAFLDAMRVLRKEVLDEAKVAKLDADLSTVADSLTLIDAHALNATDAAILQVSRNLASELREAGDDQLLATSDVRLERAAKAEGLSTFNPETQSGENLKLALSAA